MSDLVGNPEDQFSRVAAHVFLMTCTYYSDVFLQDRIEGIAVQAAQFVESGHFDSENIQAKQTQLLDRYKALQVNNLHNSQSLKNVQLY